MAGLVTASAVFLLGAVFLGAAPGQAEHTTYTHKAGHSKNFTGNAHDLDARESIAQAGAATEDCVQEANASGLGQANASGFELSAATGELVAGDSSPRLLGPEPLDSGQVQLARLGDVAGQEALTRELFQGHAFRELGKRMAATRLIYDVLLAPKAEGIVGKWFGRCLFGGALLESGEKTTQLVSGSPEVMEHLGGAMLETGAKVFGVVLNGIEFTYNVWNTGWLLAKGDWGRFNLCAIGAGMAKVVVSGVGLGLAIAATIASGGLALAAGSLAVAVTGMVLESFEERIQVACMGSKVRDENITAVMDHGHAVSHEEKEEIHERVHILQKRMKFEGDTVDFLEWFAQGHAEFMKKKLAVSNGDRNILEEVPEGPLWDKAVHENRQITPQLMIDQPALFEEMFTKHVHESLKRSQEMQNNEGLTNQHQKELVMTRDVLNYIKMMPDITTNSTIGISAEDRRLWTLYFLRSDFSEIPRRSTDATRTHEHKKKHGVLQQIHEAMYDPNHYGQLGESKWLKEIMEQDVKEIKEIKQNYPSTITKNDALDTTEDLNQFRALNDDSQLKWKKNADGRFECATKSNEKCTSGEVPKASRAFAVPLAKIREERQIVEDFMLDFQDATKEVGKLALDDAKKRASVRWEELSTEEQQGMAVSSAGEMGAIAKQLENLPNDDSGLLDRYVE